jgi:hypothetical protein
MPEAFARVTPVPPRRWPAPIGSEIASAMRILLRSFRRPSSQRLVLRPGCRLAPALLFLVDFQGHVSVVRTLHGCLDDSAHEGGAGAEQLQPIGSLHTVACVPLTGAALNGVALPCNRRTDWRANLAAPATGERRGKANDKNEAECGTWNSHRSRVLRTLIGPTCATGRS